MTTQELYLELKLLVNKNGRRTNIDIPKANFVILFNREQERWLNQTINKKRDSDDLDDIEELLVYDEEAFYKEKKLNYVSYSLPKSYFQIERIKVTTDSPCSKALNARPVNLRNINELLQDEFNKPSLEWEETIYTIAEDTVKVYFEGFDIDKVYITYYKKPKKVDLEGYTTIKGVPSSTVESDLSDVYLEQILDRVAKEINREFENPNGFQFSSERVQTEERESF